MRWMWTGVMVLGSEVAVAAPMQLQHSMRLTTVDGTPVDGETSVTVRLFDAPAQDPAAPPAVPLWEDVFSGSAVGGYFTVLLGSGDAPLESSVFAGDEVWLEVQVGNGQPLAPRTRLVSVPYAVQSNTANGLRVVDAEPASDCTRGEVLFDTSLGDFRVCTDSGWLPPVSGTQGGGTCVVPWHNILGFGTLSDGITTDSVFSNLNVQTPPHWNSVALSYDFVGDFEVIASWAEMHMGAGIVHGPTVSWEDIDGTREPNGVYWGSMSVTGFPIGYPGAFKGHYAMNSGTGNNGEKHWIRWLRTGGTVSIEQSTTSATGPWTHIPGSPYSVPEIDIVVVGIGEGNGNNVSQTEALQLVSCSNE